MPLSHGKSKKAFKHNIEAEMDAGKPQPQALAIAYSVKRKAKKKMAEGGPVSAKTEQRPMPEQRGNDAHEIAHNAAKKALVDSGVLDQPTVAQAQRPSKTPLKHPKMVPSNAFSVRLRDEEDHLQESAKVNDGPQEQPPRHDDEEGANRQGPKVAALEMKKMADGGHVAMEIGKGPEEDEVEHPAGLEEDDDMRGPAHDEYMAGHFAEGGMLEDEMEEEHHDSIAAAIMAKRHKMAEGGQVDIDENAEEQPNGYYARNEDAALKENYDSDMDDVHQPMDSNEHGDAREDAEEDKHDMISSIRRKIAAKRHFGR